MHSNLIMIYIEFKNEASNIKEQLDEARQKDHSLTLFCANRIEDDAKRNCDNIADKIYFKFLNSTFEWGNKPKARECLIKAIDKNFSLIPEI